MKVYSKIGSSIKGCMNASNRPLEDGPSVVTKALPYVSLIVLGGSFLRVLWLKKKRKRWVIARDV